MSVADNVEVEGAMIASGRPRRKAATHNVMEFTDSEIPEYEEEIDLKHMQPPKETKRKPSAKKNERELELRQMEFEWEMEREKVRLEMKRLEIELERVKRQENVTEKVSSMPFKVKLQAYDHERGEDIVTFLAEFETVAKHAKWSNELKVLQLRTLLTGEARYVATQACGDYLELRKGLIDRFGRRPHEHFTALVSMKKGSTETYRGLMARIDQHIKRFLDDRDPVICLREEFFLKALPQDQAQWIRRNKGSSPVVEAAEDYIPTNTQQQCQKNMFRPNINGNSNRGIQNLQQQAKVTSTNYLSTRKNMQCYRCRQWGHIASKCPTDDMKHRGNPATCFVRPTIGERLISETGCVNGREIMFVKDTGSDMTLIREDLVDESCKLEGHQVTLYTAVGQPFTAQLAVVNINTTYYKGPAQVGLVPNLAAEALLGMDILSKKGSFVVTRSMAKGLDDERTVENTHQCEDESKNEVVNDSIEQADTDQHDDIEFDTLSTMNADMLSNLQIADISLKIIRDKSFATREEAEEEPMAFFWENAILRRKWQSGDGSRGGEQIVVPAGLRKMVMGLAHDRPLAGHLGLEKTKERILQSFFWPGVFSDVKRYCTSCHECQITAKRTAGEKAPMVCPPVITEPFLKIAMDIVGPLSRTKSGHKYILTVIDDATRYPEAFPLKDMEATSVARALIELFSRVGFPRVILTDKGTNFTSTLLKQLYELVGIRGVTTTPYHPQANGKVERFNGTLKSMLRKFCTDNKNEWDEMLPYLLFAYREVPHEETGFAPFEMLYGWPVRGPMQILQGLFTGEEDVRKSTVEHVVKMREKLADIGAHVKDNLLGRQKKIKALYDRHTRTREFSPGDEVLILLPSSSSKMKAQWQGPYRVVRKVNDVNYQISVPGRRGMVTYHINLLRRYKRAVLLAMQTDENDGVDIDFPPRAGEGDAGVKLGVNLSKEQREDIRTLCKEFQDVLTTRPGRTNILTHSIKTTSETPIKQRPYRIPFAQQKEVKAILDEMLEQGLIRPSISPWSSPCVLVDKKDGTLRLCVDYRKLNNITLFDAYPVPRMDDLFEKIGYGSYLSQIDLTKGYWQVPLAEESRQKSAFVTPFGLYEFNVMPFGMKTAPASFARLIDLLVSGLHNVAAYFDNIIVSSKTWSEHIENLRALLQRIREDGLTIKPSKCEFGAAEIECLGHIIGGGKIKTDTNKIKAMREFPLPTTKKGIRSFLGMVGYYRKFIKNFAEVAVPLTSMTQKGRPNMLVWTEDAVQSFKMLKDALTKTPVLIAPDFGRKFIVQTDASDTAIGAVLSQTMDGDEHAVAYLSRKLLPREQKYATIEKECLAIVWAIDSLRYYLSGTTFEIVTDHNPLTWLNQMQSKNQRLLRWCLALQPYNFIIKHRSGKQHGNADGLSRM